MSNNFTDTEVGRIPSEWEVRTLGDVCRTICDGTHFTPIYVPHGVPFYSVENVTARDFVNCKYITENEHQQLIKRCNPARGDILMTRITAGVVGDTYLIDWDVNASIYVSLALLKPNDSIDSGYLYRYSRSPAFIRDVEKRSLVNATPKKINMKEIGAIPLPVPRSISEQRAIAAALSDVDELIGALDKLIAKKRAIKLATMQQLLTGKTRLPGFGGEWCRTTLGELTSFLSGGTPSRKNDAFWCGDIPWISATSLRCFEIWRSDSNVTAEAVESGSKMAPIGSTLLLVRGSALHKEILCGLVKRPVCFNQDVKALVPHSRITPLFLTTLLRGRESDLLKLVSSAGNTAGVLDTKVLKAFEITLPQQDEQSAITQVLTDMSNEIAFLEQRRDKTTAIKQGMMQSLLTGRMRLVEPLQVAGGNGE